MATPTSLPATFVSGNVLTAAQMNNLRGAFRILQVVNSTHSSQHINSAATYSATGLDATITPSSTSSKVLVIITNPMAAYGEGVSSNTAGKVYSKLYRAASEIFDFDYWSFNVSDSSATEQRATVTLTYLDSPATTSAVTYEQYISSQDTAYSAYSCVGNKTASITLLEVSA